MIRFLIATFVCLVLSSAYALNTDSRLLQPDPSDDWQTLSTDHFDIHFRSQDHTFAQTMAAIAEKVHAEMQPLYPFSAPEKTQITINDSVDFSNGAATPVPYNQFFIFIHAPSEGDLMSHNDWSELVFRHEYTHILHINQVSGAPSVMRKIFGKAQGSVLPLFLYPQAWAPSWIAEGFAIYQESQLGYGRTGSAITDAKMRHEVLKGGIALNEISYEGYSGKRWPYGQNYTYGANFFDFLEIKHGRDGVLNYINNYSDNIIPWRINARAREATGLDARSLWKEYQQFLDEKYQAQLAEIKTLGNMPGDIITSEPYLNQHLTPAPSGGIYYYHSDGIQYPEIRLLRKNGEHARVAKIKSVTLLNWHHEKGLLVGKTDICENRKAYNDLYLIKPGTNSPLRLTHCARILEADWSIDGSSIYAVQNQQGIYRLIKFDLSGALEVLSTLKQGDVFGGISTSPVDSALVVSVKRRGQGWNLEQFNTDTGQWRPLTDNNDLESQPVFSHDGASVYFLSDKGNRLELRSLDLDTNTITTLTNTTGYIVEHSPHPDGSVWVTEYTGTGEVVRRIDSQQTFGQSQTAKNESSKPVNTLSTNSGFNPDSYQAISKYKPLKTVKPTGWTPVFLLDSTADSLLGIDISGNDALGFHQWALTPGIVFNDEKSIFGGSAFYSYDNRFSIFAKRDLDSRISNDSVELYDVEDNIQFLAHKPYNHLDWSTNLSAGIGYERIKRQHLNPAEALYARNTITGVAFEFNNLNFWHYSNIPTDGYTANLTLESYDLLGNSNHSGEAIVLGASGHYNLGNNQTLSLRADIGLGDDQISPFLLGDSDDTLSSLGGITRLGKREFGLRGYDNHPQLSGASMIRLTTEWNFPIATFQNGLTFPPVGLGNLHATAFVDTGSAWTDNADRDFFTGIGAELHTDLLLGYDSLSLPITIGLAHGLDSSIGESQVYFQTRLFF